MCSKTNNVAVTPTSIPTAIGKNSHKILRLRNITSNKSKVKEIPSELISVLSLSAFCFASIANNAVPATSIFPFSADNMWRFWVNSAGNSTEGFSHSCAVNFPLSSTQVISLSTINNIPFSAFHCSLPGCSLLITNRPKPSQSCSSGNKLLCPKGFASCSA